MTRERRARGPSAAIAALALTAGLWLPACGEQGATATLCALGGQVYLGSCPTRCESQCALAEQAGCQPPSCVSACEASELTRKESCLDARYAHWRCLRRRGYPAVRCEGSDPVYEAPVDACLGERQAEDELCPRPQADAGDLPDGAANDGAPPRSPAP